MADRILIEGLEVACIVGIRPPERVRKQLIRLTLDLGIDLSRAGRSGKIAHTVNYSRVAQEVTSLLQFRAYKLIEGATEELCATLLAVHPALDRVTLRVEKPEALRGRARFAAVEVTRLRAEFETSRQGTAFGETEALLESDEAKLFLLRIAPGRTLERTSGSARRIEWLVQGRLLEGESELALHTPRSSEAGPSLPLHNPGLDEAVFFSCETSSRST